ncbi:MAG: UDP-N-acetylmuramate--L-alanine ligase [Bacteroidia bacterium]|nr:UDP-N-acetylmuramate--L-alanine ligase [Bacteroidia bacterium]MBT8276258.1 UDP-N-acetylmuramate--L-alanine ligase [Bacteroidia bacterium]NNK53332.1 UDP-N-acetylmuramate--L-alanine ligase [Flavobacteriaceae bacterium]NNM08211.1 UDP-N-acetylmuramate--L-alanine ligase [Flavobacteriaceae bacterium]
MRDLGHIQALYFIGIGGIGMSALARFVKLQGKEVYGYDKTETQLTQELEMEGIRVTYQDSVSEIPMIIKNNKNSLVVYTPAVPKDNTLLNWFRSEGFTVIKRAQFLGEVTRNTLCLAVAGTHGKTTTSAILGHLLADCDMPVTAFLGGITENYNSNFISKGTEITVVEADEFDRSFLSLNPDIACVTSMDADHLDIYGDEHTIESAFQEFANLIPSRDKLLHKKGLPLQGKTVAVEETADFEARNVRIEDGCYQFDLKTPSETIKDLQFILPGHHNLQNAVTALGMAILAGSPTHCLPKALSNFKGVQRRFSYLIKREDLVLIDDYAHHPTEIDALSQAVNELYPDDLKLIVFQPHLYSRTKDFIDGFAESLSNFDEVILLDIYPARELPIEGVTSSWLGGKIRGVDTKVVSKKELPAAIKASGCRIKLIVGAGDIGSEAQKLMKYLNDED